MVPDSIASTKTRLFTRNLFIVFIILTASFIIMDFVFWEIEDKIQTHDIISESFIIIFFMAALIIWVRAMRNYETILVAIALAVLSYAAVINLLDEFFDQPQGFGDADQFVNLLGLIIFVVAVFAITACKKENTGEINTPQMNESKKIEALILNFKDKLENNLKDGTTYAADSAVWYVEALLNYSYGDASIPCKDPMIDTVEHNINTLGSNIFTLEQLSDVYESIEEDVLDEQPENATIYSIDLYLYNVTGVSVFAARTAYNLNYLQFKAVMDTAGYWYWGYNMGMCDSDSGLYVGTDAADILEDLINTITCDYWTSLETKYASPNSYIDPNFPFTNTVLHPTRLFSATDQTIPVQHPCLSPGHIAYYDSSNGIHYIINDLCPERKSFMYIVLTEGYADGYFSHSGSFTYGTPN